MYNNLTYYFVTSTNVIEKEKHNDNREASESERYTYEYVFPYRIWKGFGREYRYEICIVSLKRSPEIKLIRFRKRYFGISKKMQLSGETEPQWINQRSFNLNPKKDFPRFYDIINKYKRGKLEEVNDYCIKYLNRLSDLLFVLGRIINKRKGKNDVVWKS